MKTLRRLFEKKYVVAATQNGYIAYDIKHYNEVLFALDYVAPKKIATFRTWGKALVFLEKLRQEHAFAEVEEWGN